MRILHLTLNKWPFDMIASGEKLEEYRDIKKHWFSRLCATSNLLDGFKEYDVVEFKNGYSSTSPCMQVECKGIDVGEGKHEWGASGREQFIIKLGKILSIKNYEPCDVK